ncbi:sulfotransferase domain-containing protein [Zhongshania sp.]|jgi:hypothetical protein|uniref:sulfotransferase domain-containing protein n=1 Tax=Zhongshania sp. TaxID=1971902 RepID=UPI002A81ACDE|nr:sulfotransferase domain-containing protein [Zhongshania sp.]
MSYRKKVNLFLIGAPKAGTTSVAKFLDLSREISVSKPKEPGYFAVDCGGNPDRNGYTPRNIDEYEDLWLGGSQCSAKYWCDASTNYSWCPGAIRKIKAYNANAKCIYILRHPIEAAYSLYCEEKYQLNDPSLSFEDAWLSGSGQAASEDGFSRLNYGAISSFGARCAELLELFDRSNVHICFLEDLVTDEWEFYSNLASFLGVKFDRNLIGIKENTRKVRVNVKLAKILLNPPSFISPLYVFLKVLLHKLGIRGVRSGLLNAFSTGLPVDANPNFSAAFARKLEDYFSNDIEILSDLCGRDLAHWHRCPQKFIRSGDLE